MVCVIREMRGVKTKKEKERKEGKAGIQPRNYITILPWYQF